jgi:hypothetical protein
VSAFSTGLRHRNEITEYWFVLDSRFRGKLDALQPHYIVLLMPEILNDNIFFTINRHLVERAEHRPPFFAMSFPCTSSIVMRFTRIDEIVA